MNTIVNITRKNKDKIISRTTEYYEKNKEHLCECFRKYYKDHKEYFKLYAKNKSDINNGYYTKEQLKEFEKITHL